MHVVLRMERTDSVILNEDKNQNAISLVPNEEAITNNSSAEERREKAPTFLNSPKSDRANAFGENVIKPQVIYVASASNPEGSPREVLRRNGKVQCDDNCVSKHPCSVSFTVDILKPRVIYVTSALTSGSPTIQNSNFLLRKFNNMNENIPRDCKKTEASQIQDGTTRLDINARLSSSQEEKRPDDIINSNVFFDDHSMERTQNDKHVNFENDIAQLDTISADRNQTIDTQVKETDFVSDSDNQTNRNIRQGDQEIDMKKEINSTVRTDTDVPIIYSNKAATTAILDETCCSISVISSDRESEIEITSNLSLDDCAIEDIQTSNTLNQNGKGKPVNPDIFSLNVDDHIYEPQMNCIASGFTVSEHSSSHHLWETSQIQTNDNKSSSVTDRPPTKNSDKISLYSFTGENMCVERNYPLFSRMMLNISFLIRHIYLNCAIHSRKLIVALIFIISGLLLVGVGSVVYY